jgi:hypothetical protein
MSTEKGLVVLKQLKCFPKVIELLRSHSKDVLKSAASILGTAATSGKNMKSALTPTEEIRKIIKENNGVKVCILKI